MDGWIKMDRSIMEHWIYPHMRKFTPYEAWTDMLFMTNFSTGKLMVDKTIVEIKRGSFISSELQLGYRWLWSRNEVRSFLKMLEKDLMILKNSTTKYTMITICNYELYQGNSPTNQQRTNNKATTKQQPTNTIEEGEESKECKPSKEPNIPFEIFWDLYSKKTETKKCKEKWLSLSDAVREKIIAHVPKYVLEHSDVKYRKDPIRYLTNECWNDEGVTHESKGVDFYRKLDTPARQIRLSSFGDKVLKGETLTQDDIDFCFSCPDSSIQHFIRTNKQIADYAKQINYSI